MIRAELRAASLTCDISQMERLLLEGSRGRSVRQEFLLPLARLYEELSCKKEAEETWRASFDEEASLEAAYQILRHGEAADRGAIKDKVETLFSAKALAAVEDLLRLGPTPPRTHLRHLAILPSAARPTAAALFWAAFSTVSKDTTISANPIG